MANTAKLVLQIDVDDKGNPVLKDMDKNMKKATKSASALGSTLKQAAASLALWKGINALQNSVAFATKEIFDFNKVLKQTQAITGTSPKNIEALKDLVLDLGNVTEFTASEIAGASLQISKMGVSVQDQIALLPDVLNLATASVVDLASAVDVAGQTTKAFGFDMKDLGQVANIIQTTVSSTAIGLDDFAESMKFVAPIAKTAGVTIQDLSASIGILGDIGIKGSLAGTSLKNIMTNLLDPTEKVAAALRKFGLDGKPLPIILKGLKDAGLDVNDFLDGFNLRALAGALALRDMSDQSEVLREKLVAQSVTVKKVADVIRTSWIDQLEEARNAMVNTAIEFSRVFEDVTEGGALKDFKKFWVDLQQDIRNNRKEIREFVQNGVDILVDSLRWFSDNRHLIGTMFKIFLSGLLIKQVIKVAGGLTQAAVAMKAFGVAATAGLKGVPKTLTGITAALGPLTLAFVILNETLDFIASNLERAAEFAAKSGGDITKAGTETKKRSLVELRPFLAALITARDQMDAAVKIQREMEKSGRLNVMMNQNIMNAVKVASKEFTVQQAKIKESTGLGQTFIDLFPTLEDLDKGIKDFGIQIKKSVQLEKELLEAKKRPLIVSPKGVGFSGKVTKDEKAKGKTATMDFLVSFYDTVIAQAKGFVPPQSVIRSLVATSDGFTAMAETVTELALTKFPALSRAIDEQLRKEGDIVSLTKTEAQQGVTPTGKFGPTIGGIPLFDSAEVKKAKDAMVQLQVDVANFNAEMENTLAKLNEEMGKAVEEQQEFLKQRTLGYVSFALDQANALAGGIKAIMDVSMQNEKAALDKRQTELDKRKDEAIKRAKGSKGAIMAINRKFDKEQEQLDKENLEKEKEHKRKQKAMSITQALINTALAITNALANVPYPLNLVAAGVAGVSGAAQVAAISAQNFRDGGIARGNSSSDSIPAMLSIGEAVIPARQVASLGGQRGVQQALADDIDFVDGLGSTGGGQVVLQIDTFIGTEEFKRELFLDLEKEAPRWLSGV